MPKLRLTLILILVSLVFVGLSHPAMAEIATGRDWIGIYTADIADSDINGLNNPYSWTYTSSCNQTANIRNPLLAGSCTWNVLPVVSSGAWVYRFFPNDSLYVADKSEYFWVTFNLNRATELCEGEEPVVELAWDPVTGVSRFDIARRTGAGAFSVLTTLANGASTSYVDRTVANGTSYTYEIRAHSASEQPGDVPPYLASNPSGGVSVTTRASCQRPFIKTEGGAVHTNEEIDVPDVLP